MRAVLGIDRRRIRLEPRHRHRRVVIEPPRRLRQEQTGPLHLRALERALGATPLSRHAPHRIAAERCERDGVWLHVDAAYAGAAMVCPEHRWAFEGVERALHVRALEERTRRLAVRSRNHFAVRIDNCQER